MHRVQLGEPSSIRLFCLYVHSPDAFPSNDRPVVSVVVFVGVLALVGGVLALFVGVLALWLSWSKLFNIMCGSNCSIANLLGQNHQDGFLKRLSLGQPFLCDSRRLRGVWIFPILPPACGVLCNLL